MKVTIWSYYFMWAGMYLVLGISINLNYVLVFTSTLIFVIPLIIETIFNIFKKK